MNSHRNSREKTPREDLDSNSKKDDRCSANYSPYSPSVDFSPQKMMVILREAVGFIAHVLEESQGVGMAT